MKGGGRFADNFHMQILDLFDSAALRKWLT